ncbi:MAG: hypothetical protein K2Y28_17825 [Burkholderiaceae bacterium]|nr:hypothetical protein [Burkholderiaceae bacterium]
MRLRLRKSNLRVLNQHLTADELRIANIGSESILKKVAVVLLLLGFGWLCQQQIGLFLLGERPGLRVLLSQLDAPHKATYTKAEVEQIGREAVAAQYAVLPIFTIPGIVIVLGGLLAAWPRRPRSNDDAA